MLEIIKENTKVIQIIQTPDTDEKREKREERTISIIIYI